MNMRCIRSLCSGPPNYFTLFSLTPSYSIDLTALSTRYRELQSECHPDKHTNSPVEDQEHFAAKSALLNKAYRCLRDPYCRAKTLLQVVGVEPTATNIENEFLMEMMDFNDEVELCEDLPSLQIIRETNEAGLTALFSEFEQFFADGQMEIAANRLTKCKFLLQTRDRIDQREEFLTVL